MYAEKKFKGNPEDIEISFIEHFKKHGYFVVAEVDVEKILLKNFNEDIGIYKILEICKPIAAKELITQDEKIGLYLPCKAVINYSKEIVTIRMLMIEDIATRDAPAVKERISFYQQEFLSIFNSFNQ